MSKEIGSYPKIYNLGHRAVREIFNSSTVIQEKVDGSQISFMWTGDRLYVRSKRQMLYFENPEKMFALGMEQILQRRDELTVGWIYRGEYLQKPKHNVLKYDRVPKDHIILYDVQNNIEDYLSQDDLKAEAERLGFETVPWFYGVHGLTLEHLSEHLLLTSCLGGCPVEGVVIKNYSMWDPMTGKTLMAKHVSEAFKEVHQRKQYKQGNKDIIQSLVERYRTDARWQKAVQHLREEGLLKDSPEDIGSLIKEVNIDVMEECREEIEKALFKWGWKQIGRGITKGLPEWYKQQLLEKQFEVK